MIFRLRHHLVFKFACLIGVGIALSACATAPSKQKFVNTPPSQPKQTVRIQDHKQTNSIAHHQRAYAQTAEIESRATDNSGETETSETEINDKNERVNRAFFAINRRFDVGVIKPISKFYGAIIPAPIRLVIRNGYRHLDMPRDVINYTLQGEGDEAGIILKRFFINSTLGLGGAFDVADHMGIPYKPTDFGVTLGKMGVAEGRYLVNPFLGPSTVRDSIGRIGDMVVSPLSYVGFLVDLPAIGLIANRGRVLDQRERDGDLIDNVIYASPDPYTTLRSTFLQRRRAKISGGIQSSDEALPEIVTAE